MTHVIVTQNDKMHLGSITEEQFVEVARNAFRDAKKHDVPIMGILVQMKDKGTIEEMIKERGIHAMIIQDCNIPIMPIMGGLAWLAALKAILHTQKDEGMLNNAKILFEEAIVLVEGYTENVLGVELKKENDE